MKRKSLNKKIRRLQARIAKNSKKLARLTARLVTPKRPARKIKPKSKSFSAANSRKPKGVRAMSKKKRTLSPEGRAKLAAMMKARWAAKRAAGSAGPNPQSGGQDGGQPS